MKSRIKTRHDDDHVTRTKKKTEVDGNVKRNDVMTDDVWEEMTKMMNERWQRRKMW